MVIKISVLASGHDKSFSECTLQQLQRNQSLSGESLQHIYAVKTFFGLPVMMKCSAHVLSAASNCHICVHLSSSNVSSAKFSGSRVVCEVLSIANPHLLQCQAACVSCMAQLKRSLVEATARLRFPGKLLGNSSCTCSAVMPLPVRCHC